MLQLLDDANNCPQIPASLRYDLSASPPVRPTPEAKADTMTDHTQETLQDIEERVNRIEHAAIKYRELVELVIERSRLVSRKSSASLSRAFYPTLNKPQESSADAIDAVLIGALTAREEEQYTNSMTAYLDGKSTTMRPYAAEGMASERAVDRERELQLRNPVSVYNWLRKHQPGVFLQDHEGHSEKISKAATSRSSKRSLGNGTVLRQEHEMYEDDGMIDMSSLGKLKRKRNDDPGYRPKGGTSRPLKRKKEDSSISSKRVKKGAMSNV